MPDTADITVSQRLLGSTEIYMHVGVYLVVCTGSMKLGTPNEVKCPPSRHRKPKDKPYKLSDGGGLSDRCPFLALKYRVSGKEKLLAIGVS